MPEIAPQDAVLLLARLLTGLLAGLYVAFVVAIMPALHGLPDDVFVTVMNRINEVIVNPAFMLLFFGAPVAALVLLRWQHGPIGIIAAVAGVLALVITIGFNIPLNDALAAGGTRAAFETPWVTWHALRTAVCVVSFGATLLLTAS